MVIAVVHGEFTVKTLELHPRPRLVARNPNHGPIDFPEDSDIEIWGVVMHVVHTLRHG